MDASEYHGATGLHAPGIGAPTRDAEAEDAVSFLIRTLRGATEKVTLVASGPLTNIAIMLRLAPDVIDRIEQIVFMGGSTDYGNDSPAAEFNFLCDPHAAQIVLAAPVRKVMFGLNLTHQVIATPRQIGLLRDLGNEAASVFADMAEFFQKVYVERYGFEGSALHDPCIIAWLLRPELFETRQMRVDVETSFGLSYGRSVHDIWGIAGKDPSTEVAMRADVDGFFELMRSLLARLR